MAHGLPAAPARPNPYGFRPAPLRRGQLRRLQREHRRQNRPAPVRGPVGIAIVLCTALVASFTYLSDQARLDPETAVTAFLPADGQAWTETEVLTEAGTVTERSLITEAARVPGAVGIQSLDALLIEDVTNALGDFDAAVSTDLLRTTTTRLTPDGTGSDTDAQVIRLYRVTGDLGLVAEIDGEAAFVYDPPLVLLPENQQDGHTWTSGGPTNLGFSYNADLTVHARPGECLRVSGQIDYGLLGQSGAVRQLEQTWCRGAGLTAASESIEDAAMTLERAPAVLAPPDTTAPVGDWDDPARWSEHRRGAQTHHPALGHSPLQGQPTTVPSVWTTSGVLVRASRAQDLMAFTDGGEGHFVVVWSAHPGTTVLRMAAFGNVIVASTSGRELVAYSDSGVRLWQSTTSDAVMQEIVRIDEHRIAAVSVSGHVEAFDLRTGLRLWHRTIGSGIRSHPVLAGEVLLVSTESGQISALSVTDGDVVWRAELPSSLALGVVGEVALSAGYTYLTAFDLRDGRPLWNRPIGRVRAIVGGTSTAALVTAEETVALDHAGAVQWTRPGAEHAVADAGHVALLGLDTLIVMTWDGQESLHVDLGGGSLGESRSLFAAPGGVALTGTQWGLRLWRP